MKRSIFNSEIFCSGYSFYIYEAWELITCLKLRAHQTGVACTLKEFKGWVWSVYSSQSAIYRLLSFRWTLTLLSNRVYLKVFWIFCIMRSEYSNLWIDATTPTVTVPFITIMSWYKHECAVWSLKSVIHGSLVYAIDVVLPNEYSGKRKKCLLIRKYVSSMRKVTC